MQAMILAAGLGTRLRPFTLRRPKPLFPVLDIPLLEFHLTNLIRSGFDAITVNAHHLGEQIGHAVSKFPEVRLQNESEILGTGGGLRLAVEKITDPAFLVVNSDIVHNIDLAPILAWHTASRDEVTMVLHDCPRFNNVWVDRDQLIRGFGGDSPTSEAEEPCRKLAYTGIQAVNSRVFQGIAPGKYSDLIDWYRELINAGVRIRALEISNHYWTDIGTQADYLALHGDLLTGRLPADTLPGLPTVEGGFYVGPDAELAVDVVFDDWVCIGRGAKIGPGVRLARVVVWDGASVSAGAELSDIIVV